MKRCWHHQAVVAVAVSELMVLRRVSSWNMLLMWWLEGACTATRKLARSWTVVKEGQSGSSESEFWEGGFDGR